MRISKTIRCYTPDGQGTLIAEENLLFHPAVYGVFIENGRVLLLHDSNTNLWRLPGGLLSNGQRPSHAIRHQFRQVMGFLPELGILLQIEERYHIDEKDQARCISAIYYALHRPTALATTLPQQAEALQPEFVPVATLERRQLQFGYKAIQAGLRAG